MTPGGITPGQIRAIWGCASRLKISEKDLRDWIFRRTRARSLRALTRMQASGLIKEALWKLTARGEVAPVRRGMTPGQLRFLEFLKRSLGWDDDRLLGLARRMYHVERLQELRLEESSGLIEALKSIRRRNAA